MQPPNHFNPQPERINPFALQHPSSRPQTPISNFPSGPNRSFQKVAPGGYNPIYPAQNPKISRSRASMNSSASQLNQNPLDSANIFPEQIVFLLRNQQKSITAFKDKIEREKQRVENDFSVLKAEIIHILEDVKISVQAELDECYKSYITKYAELKGEVQELRIMRKQILMNNSTGFSTLSNPHKQSSNKDLIGEIEKDAEHMRQYRVYGYLSELQKQKLEPMVELTDILLLLGKSDLPFYRSKEMNKKLNEAKNNFRNQIGDLFSHLSDYVLNADSLRERNRQEHQESKAVLRELDRNNDHLKFAPFVEEQSNPHRNRKTSVKEVAPTQQAVLTRACEQIEVGKGTVITTDHADAILCIYFVNNKFIATGSKDKTVKVYSLDGKKIATLAGHNASICCLSVVQNASGQFLLASGSDHGCSSLILWDSRSWTITTRVQSHQAAVTAIVDMQDRHHLVTGSYDKKINLFNFSKGQAVSSLNNNGTSITGMVLSSDNRRLIVSGIDNSLSVWAIGRKNGQVDDIRMERTIAGNSLICQIQACILRPQIVLCATRDGNIKMFNVQSGEVEKSFTVNANSLIQLVVVERESKPDSPITLSCSSKDTNLVMTRMDTGISSLLRLSETLGIDFGCGIGPKIIINGGSQCKMAALNQHATSREFTLYPLNLKSYFQ